ncbi:MAG: tetratricopeptide repeat protein [Spirochaetales bacterium]|nr:tetratricopeptide repeat protein [Spirochaetales bacterium]
MAEEDGLKEYIELLERLPGGLPDEKTLKKLQAQCGLQPGDLKKLSMLVDRHKDRADIYQHRDNVSGAIEELERACQLTPRDARLHLSLAQLYKNRYENYGFLRRDREKTKDEAQRAQTLDGSLSEPTELIKEVDRLHKSLNGGGKRKKPIVPLILGGVLLLIMVLFGLRNILIDWINGSSPAPSAPSTPSTLPSSFDRTVPHEVKVENYGFSENNLEGHWQSSRILPLNDHWAYELKGGLISPALALDSTDLELRFLDKESRLIHSRLLTLDETPLILPGETLRVDLFFFLPFSPEQVNSVSLTPQNSILLPYADEETGEMKVWWDGAKPEGVRLHLAEREKWSVEGYDRHFHYYTFDLTQRGKEKITFLELTFRWRDGEENIVKTEIRHPVRSDGPFMENGETLPLHFHVTSPFSLDWESLSCDVTVTGVELSP